jgi:hypothetical protein
MVVALGASEILYGRDYFRANNSTRFIEQVTLDEAPPQLHIAMWNPKIRGESAETWSILVPLRMVAAVHAVLPQVATHAHRGKR